MKRTAVVLVTAVAMLVHAGVASASFPGANGRIAASYAEDDTHYCGDNFHICGGESFNAVRSLTATGRGIRQLSACKAGCGDTAWSPSGKRIVWAEGAARIYIAPADGRGRRLLRGAAGRYPAFSPDGKSLVFVSRRGRLSRIATRGGRARAIAPAAGTRDSSPTWCSQGRIVFVRTRGYFPRLYSVRPDGRGLQRLTTPAVDYADCGPRGRVIYTSASKTHVMRADGRGRSRVLVDHRLNNAVFSPDGRQIAYDDGIHVWVARADGRGARRITPAARRKVRPLEEHPPAEPPPSVYWTNPSWQPLPRR